MVVIGVWLSLYIVVNRFSVMDSPQSALLGISSPSSGRKMGLLLVNMTGLVLTQGFMAPKPDSTAVLSRSSINREGSRTLYSRYCSCLMLIVFVNLSCASLSGTSECVEMWTVVIIRSRDSSFLGRWVVVKCSVMVFPWISIIGPWCVASCVGEGHAV